MTTRRGALSILLFLLFLIFLIPSAQFAWRNRDMPEFAYLHDDGVLFTSAKSLADGNGFRIQNLPENPAQTKYPPLYPALLSLIWRIDPQFPDNLQLATALGWILTSLGLGLAWKLYQSDGEPDPSVWFMVALLAVSPYWILFGTMMFSEMFFTCLVLASLILARQKDNLAAVATAGLLAACAYLTRSAGIALLISVPALLLWQKRLKAALVYAAPVIMAAAGWAVWQRGHLLHSIDSTLMYYTDYVGFQKLNVGADNALVVLWKNLDQILYSMGALVLPKVVDMMPVKNLTQVLGIGMISGVVRMFRKGIARDYALFSLLSTGILLVWHYPANERMVLPMFPLLLAGLVTEAKHFFSMVRRVLFVKASETDPSGKSGKKKDDAGNRIVGGILAAGIAAIFLVALGVQLFMTFSFMDSSTAQQRASLKERRAAYQWMAANLPREAAVLSYDDALLYLYSGHHGNYMPLLTRWWYADDHENMQAAYRNIDEYCRRRGLSYFYFTSEDLSRETGEEDRKAVAKAVAENPALEPVFTAGIGTVYRIRPATAASQNNSIPPIGH
jgi:hypothetical protein